MESLNIVWKKRVVLRFEQIADWYNVEMGKGAAEKFARNIHNTVNTLSHSPKIGTFDEKFSTTKTKYYTFLSHPKFRIIYRFTKTNLYIVAIHATLMKHN